MRALYTIVLHLAVPFFLLRLWWRGRREPSYRDSVEERLGRYSTDVKPKMAWVHAVSVGEARAAAPLVRALQDLLPDHGILMTCTTAAGRETLKQVYGEGVLTAYLPYDTPHAVQGFIEHFRPRLGVLMETEVWPNLIAICTNNGVPLMLANARMSEKSAAQYRRLAALSRSAFASLAAVCAQSAGDAERLRGLGAKSVEVTGNLKFDVRPDLGQLAAGRAWRAALGRPVLLLASTREGEERLLLDALPPPEGKRLVVVVPRHPQRFDEVAAYCQARRGKGEAPEVSHTIYLGDTMGEMAFYYGACDVAVIGGSFVPEGGQNLIEALACGAPVVIGSSVFNFEQATRLAVEAGAAIQAPDAASGITQAVKLLEDEPKRKAMARAGLRLCEAHRGAAERHLEVCRRLLKKGSGPF
ncbi:MAG TPA: 3-deoxy-D-manno-octulosonic acid transferase, partial [Burkholderiales bacterium]|nr:3-deoxy-D-manno-octulosonic acid transferase [Burkholderiales bacterium]